MAVSQGSPFTDVREQGSDAFTKHSRVLIKKQFPWAVKSLGRLSRCCSYATFTWFKGFTDGREDESGMKAIKLKISCLQDKSWDK